MKAEDFYRAIEIQNIKGEVIPTGRELNNQEVTSLMEICAADPTSVGARDAAIIALMYSCGLRRSEVIALNLADYDPSNDRLRVMGKRRKERTAYVLYAAAQAMQDWLQVRGHWPGALFPSLSKRFGGMNHERMTSQAIYNMLAKRARQAQITPFTPHDLRRSFASHLLDARVDITTVSKMMGHSSVLTTARYDKRGELTKRKAAELLHVKYECRK